MDGLLVIDKPAGPTSHDVVARMRRILHERRIGHTGTLDPAASGVLPLVVGRATRLAQFLSGCDKEYEAIVRLGFATTTDDADGDPVEPRWEGALPARDRIERALAALVGTFDQQPPAYSAKKIAGVRSYKLARATERSTRRQAPGSQHQAPGTEHQAPGTHPAPANSPAPVPARVTLHEAEVLAVEGDRVAIRLRCSAGFYVRSLARDLGVRLDSGGHLAALRRTRSGEYGLSGALTLEAAEGEADAAREALIPMDRLLTAWASVVLTDAGVRRAGHGCDLGSSDIADASLPAGPRVRLLDGLGRLVGIAEPSATPGLLHPSLVFM